MGDPYAALRVLLTGSRRGGALELAALAMESAPLLDSDAIVLHLVDYGQVYLTPLGQPDRLPVPVDGTLPGRVYATGQTQETDTRLWLPLRDGEQRIGVVEVVRSGPLTAELRDAYEAAAVLLGQLVTTRRWYGDAIEHARRQLPMQLATEIVWNLLPPLTFTGPGVVVSGILEPCYEIGGDVFDYAVNGRTVHVALFDAIGHGISASLLSTMAVNAYRNARRCGLDLVDTYRSIDKWIRSQYPDAFLTAVIAELDTESGGYRRISAGHPAELLVRDGRLIGALPAPTAMPLGMADLDGSWPEVTEDVLQPGDTLLLYTDGVVEARSESGEFFGIDRLAAFLARAMADRLPAAETMRRLVRAILDHQHGNLQDDATALALHRPVTP